MYRHILTRHRSLLSFLEMSLLLALLALAAAAAAAAQAPAEPASPAAVTAPAPAEPAGEDQPAAQPGDTPAPAAEASRQAAEEEAGETLAEADPGRPRLSADWFWTLGQRGGQPGPLLRATILALALLIAFLTVVELWQVPPPTTSLAQNGRPAKGKVTETGQDEAAASVENPLPQPRVRSIFESNFSRIVLSGLGGIAAVSFIRDGAQGGADLFNQEGYYFVLFVFFFITGLVLSALIRGAAEAVRSRIVLSRPRALWPSLANGDTGLSARAYRMARYRVRQSWYWLVSFRATFVVFIDTVFNVLVGRNQLQTTLFSETITDLHESLLEAAERTREEVHRAVIRALVRKGALQKGLPPEEQVRVAVSLLAADGNEVYYVAWEHGSPPTRFGRRSVAWVSAFASEARWCKCDPAGGKKYWDLIYHDKAEIFHNESGALPGRPKSLPLKDYYEQRAGSDYEAFVVLPMPWRSRGKSNVHRRGCLHIAFKKAEHMDKLWEHLEHYPDGKTPTPNYDAWRGLLEPAHEDEAGLTYVAENVLRHSTETVPVPGPRERTASRKVQTESLAVRHETRLVEETLPEGVAKPQGPSPITIRDAELGSVLHQAVEVLGQALSHFDDEVYDIYVRSRRPSAEIPR